MIALISILVALFTVSCNIDETYTEGETKITVFEYCPAPGQFMGDSKTVGFSGNERTVADALAYAQSRLEAKKLISLGGFGGYIVVGFGRKINNVDGADFAVRGNGTATSSEPGIVWVMRDDNGNGQPDDTWRELEGCKSGADDTIYGYSVTYFRPTGNGEPVRWVDSQGVEGQIDYIESQHNQPSYYPTWITEESYTLTGTRIATQNFYDEARGGWIQPPYEWGYVDNYTDKDWISTDRAVNTFDISNAVDATGEPQVFDHIDFIKIQTAVNGKGGVTGEISTEISEIFAL